MNIGPETGVASVAMLPGIARQSVENALALREDAPPHYPSGVLAEPHPVFVTLHRKSGELRGCVGTYVPKYPDVVEETWRMARRAAFADTRFNPVTPDELPDLRFEVSVLRNREFIPSAADLDPARYGVIVQTADGRLGLLLPALPGIATVEQQLDVARRKGGILPAEDVLLSRFEITRVAES